jgi:hypothetical protein
MQAGSKKVCFRGKTGSVRRRLKTTLLTQLRHLIRTPALGVRLFNLEFEEPGAAIKSKAKAALSTIAMPLVVPHKVVQSSKGGQFPQRPATFLNRDNFGGYYMSKLLSVAMLAGASTKQCCELDCNSRSVFASGRDICLSYQQCRPRTINMGDDDPRLRWNWVHGLSSEI